MSSDNREAARVIYAMARWQDAGPDTAMAFACLDHEEKMISILQRKVEEAKAALANYQKGYTLRRSMDALLPNWFDLDASDHLPEEEWGRFVSDCPDEWLTYLLGHGVERQTAIEYVIEAIPDTHPRHGWAPEVSP